MKFYQGIRNKRHTAMVHVIDGESSEPLPPRTDLRNHSPTGLEWGYLGSGPAQLALALLADVVGDDEIALAVYQRFKVDVISKLDHDKPWELSELFIANWCARIGERKETKH